MSGANGLNLALETGQPSDAGKLKITVADDQASVGFRPAIPLEAKLQVTLALLGGGISTKVKAGESRGRELNHEFVVLGLEHSVLERTPDGYLAIADLPQTTSFASRHALAAWISSVDDLTLIQVAGGWLPAR